MGVVSETLVAVVVAGTAGLFDGSGVAPNKAYILELPSAVGNSFEALVSHTAVLVAGNSVVGCIADSPKDVDAWPDTSKPLARPIVDGGTLEDVATTLANNDDAEPIAELLKDLDARPDASQLVERLTVGGCTFEGLAGIVETLACGGGLLGESRVTPDTQRMLERLTACGRLLDAGAQSGIAAIHCSRTSRFKWPCSLALKDSR